MSISDLRHCWISLAQKYCSNRTVIYKHFDELIDAYSHKSRYYHDIFHIQFMMEMAITHRSEIEDLDTLQFSIFYHDIVYKALRKDNEIKSAELAQIRIQELGCESSMIDKSYEQIVATQFHQPTEDKDLQYLLDIDLAILGADKEVYQKYTAQVRKEYAIVPGFLYRKGRRKVLKHFLEMPFIYQTKYFRDQYESQAKENLKFELTALS